MRPVVFLDLGDSPFVDTARVRVILTAGSTMSEWTSGEAGVVGRHVEVMGELKGRAGWPGDPHG
jgi:hypothetical protein